MTWLIMNNTMDRHTDAQRIQKQGYLSEIWLKT